jgi:hypothetical protein
MVRGSVYFIQAGNRIKIGFSTRPLDRLKDLQTSHPSELEIIGTLPGTMATEAALHERFRQFRTRGEWFIASSEILRYVELTTPEGQARVKARPVPPPVRCEPPSPAVLEFKAIGRQLSSRRSKLPEAARPFVSNLIEQIDRVVDDASLERMRPFMAYQQRRLAEALHVR